MRRGKGPRCIQYSVVFELYQRIVSKNAGIVQELFPQPTAIIQNRVCFQHRFLFLQKSEQFPQFSKNNPHLSNDHFQEQLLFQTKPDNMRWLLSDQPLS